MKTISLSFAALLCVSLSYAQSIRIPSEEKIRTSILPTSYGTFGSTQMEAQTKSSGRSTPVASNVQYKHSTYKTSDGGTATFVKFNTKKVLPIKNLQNQDILKNINKEDASKVSVYPNPTNGEMTIKYFIPKNEKAEFAIYDLAGKKITSYLLTGESNQIIITEKSLYAGIYFYNVISNGNIVKQDKIVVIK